MKTKTVYRLAGAAALAAGAVFAKKNEDRRREEEEKKFSPPGVMVEVDGKRMHVLITPPAKSPEGEKPDGSSSQVIVMLPGLSVKRVQRLRYSSAFSTSSRSPLKVRAFLAP